MRAIKDSGVEWIGKIPQEWSVVKIKHKFSLISGSTPKSDNDIYWDGDISWITPTDMSDFWMITKGKRNISVEGYKSCGTTLIPKNSIVISTRAPIGKINITQQTLCTNQGCKSLVKQNSDNKFYYYLLYSAQNELI
ncbi:MAG: restriction endonuclease subunit S, partial [Desulfovibrio sp.]|nr:restriction endonuclease subunit S [Desulfovibrio sp.]